MRPKIDLTGVRYGTLTVVRRMIYKKNGRVRWEVVCDCGRKEPVEHSNLRSGRVRSCESRETQITSGPGPVRDIRCRFARVAEDERRAKKSSQNSAREKLRIDLVAEIRKRFAEQMSLAKIAKDLGISPATASKYVNEKRVEEHCPDCTSRIACQRCAAKFYVGLQSGTDLKCAPRRSNQRDDLIDRLS